MSRLESEGAYPMRTASKTVFALFFLWTVGALARQLTPYLPDPRLTPGDVFDVTVEDICKPGYAKKVRAVTKALRDQAYIRYGITSYKSGDYQIDHLVPLSLGGTNSIRNLWPHSTNTSPWDARAKDALENRLLKLVCSGQLDLQTAQRAIEANWTEAHRKYMHVSPVVGASPQKLVPTANENEVWVNTRSGKYWKPGSHFYGKTKQGEFMTESDALNRGYRPAKGTGY